MLLLVILFLWCSAIPATPPCLLAQPAKTWINLQASKKCCELFKQLHNKILAGAKSNNVKFHKPKTYANLLTRMVALEKNTATQPVRTVLGVYLRKLKQEQLSNLSATTPGVVRHTNTALRALKKIPQPTILEQETIQEVRAVIALIQNKYLPKKPLCEAFGLREVGYSAALASVAWAGTNWLANSRRSTASAANVSDGHTIHHVVDGFNIEILMPPLLETQGTNCCYLHAQANHASFAQQLKKHPEFANFSLEEKKKFLCSIRFKTNQQISDDCVSFTRKYKLDPPLAYQQTGETEYLKCLEKGLDSFDCATCHRSIATHDHGYFHYATFEPHADNIHETEPFSWFTHNLAFFDNALKKEPLPSILKQIIPYKKEYNFLYNNYRNKLNPCCQARYLIPEIIAFNQGKAVVMMASVQTLKTLSHAIATVFMKTDDGACVIHTDSLFSAESSYVKNHIHPCLVKMCKIFLTYGDVCQELERHKETIENFLGWKP